MSWTSEKCSNILQHYRSETLICIVKYFWAWHLPNPHISSSPQATLEEWGWRWPSQVTVRDISRLSAFPPFSPCVTLFVPVQNILFAIAEQALMSMGKADVHFIIWYTWQYHHLPSQLHTGEALPPFPTFLGVFWRGTSGPVTTSCNQL